MPRKETLSRTVPSPSGLASEAEAAPRTKLASAKPPSNPIPETLQSIRGYPDKLMIYRTPTSRFWQVRYPVGKKRLVRSTKTVAKQEAIEFAKTFYEDVLLRQREKLPLSSSPTFARCADELIQQELNLAKSGERSEAFSRFLEYSVRARIIPFFKNIDVNEVNFQLLNNFIHGLRDEKLAPATIKKYLVFVRKILTYAHQRGIIDTLPPFPKVKVKDKARPWLNENEYVLLRKTARMVTGDVVRGTVITDELRHFITFMVNSFLRPSDWYKLKNCHVSESKQGDVVILKLSLPEAKAANNTIVTMPVAADIYKRILKLQQSIGFGTLDDYVFLPGYTNRDYAQATMRSQFDYLLRKANLKTSPAGDSRAIYSLRHTAICLRIIKGDHVNLMVLARNCLTSVQMLDRFYCQPLSAESNIQSLISFRDGKPKS